MALHFKDYVNSDIAIEENTVGGPTYYVNGSPTCFSYTSKHRRAVRVLTSGMYHKVSAIKASMVDGLLDNNKIFINDDACNSEYPWLGMIVWDEDGGLVGEIGTRCSISAGRGTDHKGTGRCRLHAGNVQIITMRHGRVASKMRERLRRKITVYAQKTNVLDLTRELAVQRAMLDEIVDSAYTDGKEVNIMKVATSVIRLADVVGRQVERISSISQRDNLTAAQVLYLQVTVADMFTRYIRDPELRERAALELADRLGTSDLSVTAEDIMSFDDTEVKKITLTPVGST